MWRRLNEEERKNLMGNYKLGAYLVRGIVIVWILFVSIAWFAGMKDAIKSIMEGSYFPGIATAVFGTAVTALFIWIPLWISKHIGWQEIHALDSEEAYLGYALFVSGKRSQRNDKIKYYATVKLLDEWSNPCEQIECRSIGNLRASCQPGDRIVVLKIVKPEGEELIAMKNKMF